MVLAIVGILLLLLAMLVAVRIGMKRGKREEEASSPIIQGSGIYSIIRRSPRENIGDYKPSQEEIRKYLFDKNVNIAVGDAEKEKLFAAWNDQMEANIAEIESGDKEGTEFYYFDFKWSDNVCSRFVRKGRFVTREQIFQNPQIIPPFHLGCGCQLKKYQGKDKLRETTEIGMLPLFRSGDKVSLPDWKEIIGIETPFSTTPRPNA
jgi:hypothetical protein